MKTSPRIVTLAALAAGLALASCADSQPTRFYTLAALRDVPDAAMPATPPDLTVGVGPCPARHKQMAAGGSKGEA